MKQLPDLAASFGRIKTMIELEEKVNTETLFGYTIKLAFINKAQNIEIVQMIVDQLADSRETVLNCIPKWIVADIEKYWPEIKAETNDIKNINI